MRTAYACLLMLCLVASASAADLGSDAQRASGKQLYEKHCNQCHGDKGDGLGPGAGYFKPAPRDFTEGKYKVRSTASGELPSDKDIEDAIRKGLAFKQGAAFTGMPPWPKFSDEQVSDLMYYLKSFSEDFSDPEYNNPQVVSIPSAPAYSEESAKKGREVFEENECVKCHGVLGRGDGKSAPTLEDDWGFHIRAADLTKPWTFRAGSTREILFKTISTGFNGTPMPAYADAVSVEDRWHLVNYLHSLSEAKEANYNPTDRPVVAAYSAVELELTESAIDNAKQLFASSPTARIPIVGQVIEPGRQPTPAVLEFDVRAFYNASEVAIMLQWSDMQAETSGKNSPGLEAPAFEPLMAAKTAATDDSDPFADEEADPFAEDDVEEDPFADEEGGDSAGSSQKSYEFSDAVAIQFPSEMPDGFKKPYFVFGDSSKSVDLWFSDLATKEAKVFIGKGSENLTEDSSKELSVVSAYENGQWTVVFKRKREVEGSVPFNEGSFVPIAFSVWDGFSEDRGNRRGLTPWFQLYVEPSVKESPVKPMLLYGGGLFLALLGLVGFVRKRASNVCPGA